MGAGALVELAADPARLVAGMNQAAVAVNQAVDRMTASAREAMNQFNDSFERAESSASRFGNNLQDVGGKLSMVSLPIMALGAAGVKAALDMNDATTKIQNSLGVTADEAQVFADKTKAVFEQGWGESLGEVNDALITTKLNLQDMVSEADLQPLVEDAMALKQTFDAEVNESTRTASVLMKNFGIDGQAAMDMIAYGFQNGGNYSDELLDTLREYSPQFAAMGFDAGQAMNILIEGAQAGAWNLDKVGDAIKEFNIRAKDGSTTSAEAFQKLGLNAEDMTSKFAAGGEEAQAAFAMVTAALAAVDDEVARNAIGVGLFGTQYEDLEKTVVAAMGNAAKSVADFGGSMDKVKGSVSQTQQLTAAWRQLADAIGENIAPLLTPIINGITQLVTWFGQLNPHVQQGALAFLGVVAAAGPLVALVGMLITGFAALSAPILTVIGVIAGVAAVVAVVIAAWEPVTNFFINLWESIKTMTIEAWEGLKQGIVNIANSIVDFFSEWGGLILAAVTGPIGLLIYFIVNNWEQIKAATSAAWEFVKNIVVGAFEWIYNHNYYFQYLVDFIRNAWQTIQNISSVVWEAIKTFLSGIWDALKTAATNVWNGIKTITETVWNAVYGFLSNLWVRLSDQVAKAWTEIFATIKGIWDKVSAGFEDLVAKAWNWGKNLMSEFIGGIVSKISDLWDTLTEIGESVSGFLGFHSPTELGPGRYADEWAPNLMKMLAQGMEAGIPGLVKAASGAAQAMQPQFAGYSAGGSQSIGSIVVNINGVQDPEAVWDYLERKLALMGVREF